MVGSVVACRAYLCCGVGGGAVESVDCAAHAELRHFCGCGWLCAGVVVAL